MPTYSTSAGIETRVNEARLAPGMSMPSFEQGSDQVLDCPTFAQVSSKLGRSLVIPEATENQLAQPEVSVFLGNRSYLCGSPLQLRTDSIS